jgi:hypothetical protein
VTVALVLAGCGSVRPPESANAFITQVNDLCTEANQNTARIPFQMGRDGTLAMSRQLLPGASRFIKRLSAMTPPPSVRPGFSALLRIEETDLRRSVAYRAALSDGDQAVAAAIVRAQSRSLFSDGAREIEAGFLECQIHTAPTTYVTHNARERLGARLDAICYPAADSMTDADSRERVASDDFVAGHLSVLDARSQIGGDLQQSANALYFASAEVGHIHLRGPQETDLISLAKQLRRASDLYQAAYYRISTPYALNVHALARHLTTLAVPASRDAQRLDAVVCAYI